MPDREHDTSPLERLYRAPLATFVQTRKQLVAELRKAGQREAAQALAKRKKPSPTAWLANQLYHARGDAFARALSARKALADAHAHGGVPVDTMQAHLAEQRKALQGLLALAAGLSEAGDVTWNHQQARRLHDTLAALIADPDAHPLGQLERDLPAPAFDGLGLAATSPAGLDPTATAARVPGPTAATGDERERAPKAHPSAPPSTPATDAQAEERTRLAEQARRAAEEQKRARAEAARAALAHAEQARAIALQRIQAATARVTGLSAQITALQTRLDRVQQALAQERTALERAERERANADEALNRAQEALAEAEPER